MGKAESEMTEIQQWLFGQQDLKYRDFNAKLHPTMSKEKHIGVRTALLRKYAKELVKEGKAEAFMEALPHKYFEEDQIHAFILSEIKDYAEAMEKVEAFLPYIDNWATCDQLRPKAFKKKEDQLLAKVKEWIMSDLTYTKRFAVGMLHYYFLSDDLFSTEHLQWVAEMEPGEYYIDMMNAWYFATALTKQYEKTIPLMEAKALDRWVQNKSIQKARESLVIPTEQKEYLKTLKK